MRSAVIAGLALALALAPPASAGDDSEWTGDCGYESWAGPSPQGGGPNRYEGVIWTYAAVYSPTDPAAPVSATVTCTLYVNGVPADAVEATGTRVVAGAASLDFAAWPDDHVGLCMSVDFADDTPTGSVCFESVPYQIPPQEVWDAVDRVVCPLPRPDGVWYCP